MISRRSILSGAAGLALAMGVGPFALVAEAEASVKPSFFRSTEKRSSNLKPFKKWNAALQRFAKETAMTRPGNCDAKQLNVCHYNKLEKLVGALKGKDPLSQLKTVNAQLNKAKYVTDQNNWGQKDYWATPAEFMSRFGDCEDYAIAKYVTLKMLGWEEQSLRVVAVKDLNLKVGHAVLVAFHGGKVYVLDNQIKQVVEAGRIRHYQPVFSINQKFWWRHAAG